MFTVKYYALMYAHGSRDVFSVIIFYYNFFFLFNKPTYTETSCSFLHTLKIYYIFWSMYGAAILYFIYFPFFHK